MIITLAIPKGGQAKTTTAAAIWAGSPRSLAIDLDTQGSLTLIAGGDSDSPRTAFDVLTGKCAAASAVQELEAGDLIASSVDLSDVGDLSPLTLRDALMPVKKKYKHIVIDTAPGALDVVTLNALVAADVLVIPVQADFLPVQSLRQLQDLLEAVREYNPGLRLGGLLLTKFNPRSNLRKQMRDLISEQAADMGTRVFKTTIRDSVVIPESQAMGKTIFAYAPRGKVTQDYRAFLDELEGALCNG